MNYQIVMKEDNQIYTCDHSPTHSITMTVTNIPYELTSGIFAELTHVMKRYGGQH